jgi:hypothetical protein
VRLLCWPEVQHRLVATHRSALQILENKSKLLIESAWTLELQLRQQQHFAVLPLIKSYTLSEPFRVT